MATVNNPSNSTRRPLLSPQQHMSNHQEQQTAVQTIGYTIVWAACRIKNNSSRWGSRCNISSNLVCFFLGFIFFYYTRCYDFLIMPLLELLIPSTCSMHSRLMHSLCLTHVTLTAINHALHTCRSNYAYCAHSFLLDLFLIYYIRYPGCYHIPISINT